MRFSTPITAICVILFGTLRVNAASENDPTAHHSQQFRDTILRRTSDSFLRAPIKFTRGARSEIALTRPQCMTVNQHSIVTKIERVYRECAPTINELRDPLIKEAQAELIKQHMSGRVEGDSVDCKPCRNHNHCATPILKKILSISVASRGILPE